MVTTTNETNEATAIVALLKQLPQEKQEFVSGYIQGILDSMCEKEEAKPA